MSTPTFKTNLGKIVNGSLNVNGAVPGIISVTEQTLSPLAQVAQSDPNRYIPNPQGAQALQVRAQGGYSNKQFVAPVKFTLNVEGVQVVVDYLGKRIVTDNNVPYRQIASLSAVPLSYKTISNASINNTNRLVKQPPQQSAASKIFNSGTPTVTQSLGGRISQYATAVQKINTQTGSVLKGKNILPGAIDQISNLVPTSQVNQALAKVPGLSVATGALGVLPGTADLTKALQNPVGAATSLVQGVFADSSINLQGGLPSVSLGSLGDIFNAAANIASSGPPTSLTGIIALEKQIKGIICDFTLPTIAGIDFNTLIKFKFHKLLATREEIFKMLVDKAKPVEAEIVSDKRIN